MNLTEKFRSQEIIIKNLIVFFLCVIFFLPKISLINIPGYHQGLRFENFIALLLLITLIVTKRLELKYNDYNYIKFYLFFVVITITSSYIGWINLIRVESLYILRLLEILPFCFLLFKSSLINSKIIETLAKYFFLACFIGIFLQRFGLMGSFDNNQYTGFSPDRLSAFTGGPWEMAMMISLSFFLILPFCTYKKKKFLFYLILTLIILILSKNKGVTIAFVLSIFLYFIYQEKKFNIRRSLFALICLILSTTLLITFFPELKSLSEYEIQRWIDLNSDANDFFGNLILLDINYVYQALKEFFIFGYVRDMADVSPINYSLHYRIIWWAEAREHFVTNFSTMIFGSGAAVVYYESFIVRIIFTLGLMGTLFFLYVLVKLPIYLISFFLISSMTIDFTASYKITILLILLHYVNTKKI